MFPSCVQSIVCINFLLASHSRSISNPDVHEEHVSIVLFPSELIKPFKERLKPLTLLIVIISDSLTLPTHALVHLEHSRLFLLFFHPSKVVILIIEPLNLYRHVLNLLLSLFKQGGLVD